MIMSMHKQAIILTSETKRINAYSEALRDMNRHDASLRKHIADMESFESNSSQNREKLLSGNSKHLLEESKTRESNKHKYARISEKLIKSAHAANECSPGIALDISKLSTSAQDLLRGKIQERTELMHLHSTTHGVRRWSGGGKEDVENSSAVENITTVHDNSARPKGSKTNASPARARPVSTKLVKGKH
jgi:hypothetical protein